MNDENGNGSSYDDFDDDDQITPPEGIKVRPPSSVTATNRRLALQAVLQHIDAAVGHGEELARLIGAPEDYSDEFLRQIEYELGECAEQFHRARRAVVEARHRRR